jgi:DNA adenine methylase
MHYLGGKSQIAKELCSYIKTRLVPGQPYNEPFVGACWTMQEISGPNERVCNGSDIHGDLIALLKALQDGWIPPDIVSEQEYRNVMLNYRKNKNDYSAIRGFMGFGCSFAGRFFEGYARCKNSRNYALSAKRSLLKKLPNIQNVNFSQKDYKEYIHNTGDLFYCDPPYEGTKNFSHKFNHKDFWDWVRVMSKNNTVLVSEYNAPEDFKIVWQKEVKTKMADINNNKIQRVEKLWELIK